MRRISSHTEERIVELWFEGVPRDRIAEMLGVSGSTVSAIIDSLPECLRELRLLAVELRKTGASPKEALKGAETLSQLKDLDLGLDQLQDFVEAAKKLGNEEYGPADVMKAAMKLSNLEQETGKKYLEVLADYEAKISQNEELKTEIEENKKELDQIRKTKRDLIEKADRAEELELNLANHGLTLKDPEELCGFLHNMRDFGDNPENFLKWVSKYGSLKTKSATIEKRIKRRRSRLNELKKEESEIKARLPSKRIELLGTENRINKRTRDYEELEGHIGATRSRLDSEVASLAYIMNVKARVPDVVQAVAALEEKLGTLEAEVNSEKLKLEELEKEERQVKTQIEELLGIRDYATETRRAIEGLEQRRISLSSRIKELEEREEEMAVETALKITLTNFLRRMTPYDFNLFQSWVKTVAEKRDGTRVSRIEDAIRMKALEAFKGAIISRAQYMAVFRRKEGLRRRNRELEAGLKETKIELGKVKERVRFLESFKANVEGKEVTLKDLAGFVADTFEKQIDQRSSEKYDRWRATTEGILNWVRQATEK